MSKLIYFFQKTWIVFQWSGCDVSGVPGALSFQCQGSSVFHFFKESKVIIGYTNGNKVPTQPNLENRQCQVFKNSHFKLFQDWVPRGTKDDSRRSAADEGKRIDGENHGHTFTMMMFHLCWFKSSLLWTTPYLGEIFHCTVELWWQ